MITQWLLLSIYINENMIFISIKVLNILFTIIIK